MKANGHSEVEDLSGCFVVVRLKPNKTTPIRWVRALVVKSDAQVLKVKYNNGTATPDVVVEVSRIAGEWRRWRPGDNSVY